MEAVEPSTPQKAGSVEVAKTVDVGALARAAVKSCCDQVRANTPGAKQGEDPNFVHQLRVGARRLRVALRLFQALLDEQARLSLESDLKWVFSRLGAQRELDVLLRDVLEPLVEQHPSPAAEALRDAAVHERDRRKEEVKRTLLGRRYARVLRGLDALEEALQSPPGPADRAARKWSRKRLEHRRDRALSFYEPALAGDPEQRHSLRKQLKKLRYASELTTSLYKPKRVKRFLDALEEVQDVLGELNDVAAGRSELTLLSHERADELGPALEACEQQFERREAEQLAKLAPMLSALAEQEPFWR